MKLLPAILGVILGISTTVVNAVVANPTESDIPKLNSERVQDVSCARVSGFFTRYHFKEIDVNDAFVQNVYDQYLSFVDSQHSLFTASEVEKIRADKNKMYKSLLNCEMTYPYELFTQVMKRRFEKYSYYLNLVKNAEFDLNTNETIYIDRSKVAYPTSSAELHKLWDQLVKNDFINLKLESKSDAEARKFLTKRYTNVLRNIVQNKNEDAFSIFENAYGTAIDPHTSYLSPEVTSEFTSNMNLSMEGIGAVLSQEGDYVKIVSLVPGSPAELSKKLKPQDKIIGVQQHNSANEQMVDVVGMRLIDVVPLVKGPKKSKVTLQIQRGEGADTSVFLVDLVRNTIRLEESAAHGEVKTIDNRKVGVLTVKSFYMKLSSDMKKEILKLNKEKIEALVIDLRQNGGGSLDAAIKSGGLFVDSSPIVQVKESTGRISVHRDNDNTTYYDGPVVVLIDRGSASSSEIFAAVIQDLGRGIIVGDTSFGKGTVQQSRPLSKIYDIFSDPMGSIHYTIGKFYRINGNSTQIKGVIPDIAFPSVIDPAIYGEATEPNALPWDQIPAATYTKWGDVQSVVPSLTQKHLARVKDNVDFIHRTQLADKAKQKLESNIISLNFAERKATSDADEKQELDYVNEHMRRLGKPTYKSVKDVKTDDLPDAYLDEALHIALDLADSTKESSLAKK